MSRLHLVAGLAVVAFTACTAQPARSDQPTSKAPVPAPTKVSSVAIVAVSEKDGALLAELPLGSADDLETGTLLRVYADQGDRRTLKGMLQVTEVLGDHRSIARGIGLTDRQDPLKVGDIARITDLAATLVDYQGQLKHDADTRDLANKSDEAAFSSLREQYHAELTAAQARLDQQLTAEQAGHDRAIADLTQRHQRELQIRDADHQADRATLAMTMREQTAAAIAADRAEREQKQRETQAENQRLAAHTERVVLELQRCQAALTKAQAESAANDALHLKALRAEVETRQVLQARLIDLEQRQGGKISSSVAVLSNDPARKETILAQLERLTDELAAAKIEQQRLAAALDDANAAHQNAVKDLEAARALADRLPAANQANEQAAAALLAAEAATATATKQAAVHERARLDAERQLYDLAGRVLALDDKPETLADLQHRLQQLVAATSGEKP